MKKTLFIAVIIIILAGLGVAGYWYWQFKHTTLFSDCKLISPNESASLDQGLYFTGCDFVWECELLPEQSSQDMCLFDLAKKNSDQDICKKIKNETQKKWCENIFKAKIE
ncbi:MAG: hypothetical protein WCV88_03320 [Patescibacteria group bacterium]|jgi:hypothetical protein